MAFDDFFRISAHGVFTNPEGKILLLKATYADKRWTLPGGSLDPGETIHEALLRECQEELGIKEVKILYLSGVYFHQAFHSHTCIFRCQMSEHSQIVLSEEHSEFGYFDLADLSEVQRHRIMDCLSFNGEIKSAKF